MNDNTNNLESCQYLIKKKENEINLLNDENQNLKNEILNINNQLVKSTDIIKEYEINKSISNDEDINIKNESEIKMKNLLKENKTLKCKNLLLLEENTILKSVKNEFEKQKKSKISKQEKIQYLIETNNFNIFYNNKNCKSSNKNILKFSNLEINYSISFSFEQNKNKTINKLESNISKNIQENEKYKNNYDQDEEINESELNIIDDDNENVNNLNYEEFNEDFNQEFYDENELTNTYDNNGDRNIKKKKKRRRKKKSKSKGNDSTNNINNEQNNLSVINNEQNMENIKSRNINDSNINHEKLSQSQKKKKKFKRKIDNMKSDYLLLLEEKDIYQKENEQLKIKINELETLLTNQNIIEIPEKQFDENNLITNDQKENINELQQLNKEITQLKSLSNKKEKKLIIDKEEVELQLNEKILEKDMIIDELTQSLSKLEKDYKLSLKQISSMKNIISNLEKGIGIEEQMNNYKSLIEQKEKEIIILTEQIKEYNSECDEIILGNTSKNKDEQIKLLINEVKSIRSKIDNILSFEGRIDNFEEFLKIYSKLIEFLEKEEDKYDEIKLITEKLKFLGENYEINGEIFYNKIMQEILGINNEDIEDKGNDNINIENNNHKSDNSFNNN